ncbi:hypothetical protein B739_0136 [Riemerella anatipestifer RA-CH-1]|uniref:Uncharacterized protein n=1 Tax=Riemerella anatipestifer RA-CH-1 TaxID=1228997 RepID=J9QZC3_RIEAN|nr:hypothetical protein B739_0136 [Riemerella anatipestifer RA-CH-1]AIH01741.1 hypothetical protein M949_0570 [Riemerella anatipestifer CH3]
MYLLKHSNEQTKQTFYPCGMVGVCESTPNAYYGVRTPKPYGFNIPKH